MEIVEGVIVMRVYNLKCPNCDVEYISLNKVEECECGDICEVISEDRINNLDRDIRDLILEENTGKIKIVYRHGKKKIVKVRKKKNKRPTAAQLRAAANARKYAHTPQAKKNFRKSIAARREAKLIGEEVNTMALTRKEILEIAKEVYNELNNMENVDEKYEKVVRNGKVVKKKVRIKKKRLTAKQKAALRKARRFAHTAAAKKKRKKSMEKRKRLIGDSYLINVGINSLVVEGFDIVIDENTTIPVEPGYMFDMYDIDENTIGLDIYNDEGDLVKEGIEVTAEFVAECFENNLLESLQEYGVELNKEFVEAVDEGKNVEEVLNDEKEEEIKEGYTIGFTFDNGFYVVTNEGKKYNLGSSINVRAYLNKKGIQVTKEVLEKARNGEEVLL